MYENIEKERQKHGLSVAEISLLLGISPELYYQDGWQGKIPAEKLRDLAQAFGCSADHLLGLE